MNHETKMKFINLLDEIQIDHSEKSNFIDGVPGARKGLSNKELMAKWEEVMTISERENYAEETTVKFEAVLEKFGTDLERSILIDKFAPQILNGLLAGEIENVPRPGELGWNKRHEITVDEAMKYAIKLAHSCMQERPAAAQQNPEK